mmetsp:Transcript_7989/g.11544  ORF Transcript_7989/g.11544 Transcript_7989/m.11544 type:complete len:262 (-) Transcript_7989:203-988(-)
MAITQPLTSAIAFAFLFAMAASFSPTGRTFSGYTRLFTLQSTISDSEEPTKPEIKLDILQPFLPATDPMYAVRGPVGENDFIVTRDGGPTDEELSNENILKLVTIECSDIEVNTLVWKCLGYRFDADGEEWKPDEVFPNWREKYATPPDLVNMKRIFSKEVDKPCLRANQALVKSIPMEFKQSLKAHLRPLGFRGYKYSELTPNKTRRAQCANWLLFYREELFGYTIEELKERREQKKEREAEETEKGKDEEWKPAVKEVF